MEREQRSRRDRIIIFVVGCTSTFLLWHGVTRFDVAAHVVVAAKRERSSPPGGFEKLRLKIFATSSDVEIGMVRTSGSL